MKSLCKCWKIETKISNESRSLIENVLKNFLLKTEAAVQTYSYENVFWKHATDLQENTHAEV